MFYLTRPNSVNRDQFMSLTPSEFRQFVEQSVEQADILILGASSLEHNIVGLLIGFPNAQKPSAYTIGYLWSLQSYRALGVEETLLVESEHTIRAKGYAHIEIKLHFFSHTRQLYTIQEAPTLLKLFQDVGWDPIVCLSTSFYIHDPQIMQERWFHLQIPDGYELFFWKDLSPQDKAALQTQQPEWGEGLDPFAVASFDPYTSLGVRHKATGNVAGWMVNEIFAQDVVAFSRLFIFPTERTRGLFVALLSNAIRYAFQYYYKARFNVAGNNPKMKTTVLRMMGHLCDLFVENYYCRKELRPVKDRSEH
jgi:GNAT superfamily N-acetyltransferase